MAVHEDKRFQHGIEQIETLIHTIDQTADPDVRARTQALVQALMDLHGSGIARMLELIAETGAAGDEIIDAFAGDELVASLLLLYDLHPRDLETRVIQALDKVRPYLRSHGGNVELLGLNNGIVHLRLQGSCHGCPSSAMTLKLAIEEAIYAAAPDVTALEVEGVIERPVGQPGSFIPLIDVRAEERQPPVTNGSGGGTWVAVDQLESLDQGAIRIVDVTGLPVLFCRVAETFYAYSSTCPACQQPLRRAILDTTALRCSACGQQFDVLRAGRGLDNPQLQLEPFPLLIQHDRVKIAVPVA